MNTAFVSKMARFNISTETIILDSSNVYRESSVFSSDSQYPQSCNNCVQFESNNFLNHRLDTLIYYQRQIPNKKKNFL